MVDETMERRYDVKRKKQKESGSSRIEKQIAHRGDEDCSAVV